MVSRGPAKCHLLLVQDIPGKKRPFTPPMRAFWFYPASKWSVRTFGVFVAKGYNGPVTAAMFLDERLSSSTQGIKEEIDCFRTNREGIFFRV